MKNSILTILLAATVIAVSAQDKPKEIEKHSSDDYAMFIKDWPEESKMAAAEVTAKYGKPDEITASHLMWKKPSNYEKIKVYNKVVQHNFPMPHPDVMEIFVNYKTPVDKTDDIIKSDGSVTIHRTKGMLSARCDKESSILVSLNCAHDIATGKKSVEQAREYHAKMAMELKDGKKPAYSEKLIFSTNEKTEDPDEPYNSKMTDKKIN